MFYLGQVLIWRHVSSIENDFVAASIDNDFMEFRRLRRLLRFLYAFLDNPVYDPLSPIVFEDEGDDDDADEDDYPLFHGRLSDLLDELAVTRITSREFSYALAALSEEVEVPRRRRLDSLQAQFCRQVQYGGG